MELALFFYVAGVIKNISGFFFIFATILAVFYIGVGVIGAINADCEFGRESKKRAKEDNKAFFKNQRWAIILSTALFLVSAFLPSKDTMYTMAAAYGVQTAAENPNVQRVAGKSLQVLEGKLDEFIKEGKKE